MTKQQSTGALTAEEHARQDAIYAQNNEYDYLIIGSGLAGLSVGALLAKAGHKVCMLEAHDIPGGYAHSFRRGDFHFCAQIHYVYGYAPGVTIYEFLKKLGLEKEITFELFDKDGYDHTVMPDGKRVKIPYGWDKLAESIENAYPGQKENVIKFTGIMSKIRTQLRNFPANRKLNVFDYITKGYKMLFLLKYKNKTLQDVFDECSLSKEAQAVLIANCGDMMSPPEELSIFTYTSLFGGYNTGAYYPTKHFKNYTEGIAKFIKEHDGCHIFYETPVNKINIEGDKIASVETENGKKFTAKNFICNADPQMMSKMIGRDKFPKKYLEALSYDYATAGTVIYLGLKDIDLKKYGFGKHNTWHLEQWDMNKIWKEQLDHNFEKPWIFISTPTLNTKEKGTTPEGCDILEIATVTNYNHWKKWKDQDKSLYRQKKQELTNRLLDLVEKKYIPNLREHIVVKVIGTNTTNEDWVRAPQGNAYGSALTPKQIGLKRLKSKTPWDNFHWCNASSGYAGFHGTTSTGMRLYMQLTGDNFYDSSNAPTDDELVKQLYQTTNINP